jgi:hypothetical protein
VRIYDHPIQGERQKATFGKINADTGIGDDIRHVQVDVPVQPGNSGEWLDVKKDAYAASHIKSKQWIYGIQWSLLPSIFTLSCRQVFLYRLNSIPLLQPIGAVWKTLETVFDTRVKPKEEQGLLLLRATLHHAPPFGETAFGACFFAPLFGY